jgi:mono/diheme cytochrome c family protein
MRIVPGHGAAALLAVATLLVLPGTPLAGDADKAAAVPEQIPYEAKWTNNPREATAESIANGKGIFASQCTMCHGKTGDGQGDLAIRLGYDVPDFTTGEAQKNRTDGELYYILTNGHGKMSGEGDRLSENVRWDLVNYMRALGPPTDE